jgi:hypothetical protein
VGARVRPEACPSEVTLHAPVRKGFLAVGSLGSTQTGVVEWPNRMKSVMMIRPVATPISTSRVRARAILSSSNKVARSGGPRSLLLKGERRRSARRQ